MAKKVKCPKMKKTKVKRDLRHNTNRKTIIKRNRKKSSSGKNTIELNSIITVSSENSEVKRVIKLPSELLSLVQNKFKKNMNLEALSELIKIYDINDDINYEYLMKCNKINDSDIKYIYTLSFKNRTNVITKHKIKMLIFKRQSKLFFYELIQFIFGSKAPNSTSFKKGLEKYKLAHFERYIIPIYEGTNELKYYYFIDIILQWFEKDKNKIAYCCLLNFSDFFKKSNLNKIDEIFYIIMRIDLHFLHDIKDENISFLNVAASVKETIDDKIKGLKLIKNSIKEDIGTIKITKKTYLTLTEEEEEDFRFKPMHYSYTLYTEPGIISYNIKIKRNMDYYYFSSNKFNYFNNNKEKKVFINYINKVLKSNVIKEYYQKVRTFSNYEFPFDDDKISNYFWKKTIFIDLDANSWGSTNREGFGIFINRTKGINIFGLGYGIYVITINHEFIGHSLGYLINTNNKIKACTYTPNQSFISENDNLLSKNLYDGGDKFETLLVGEKVDRIFIGGNHFLMNINNWNLPLDEFKEGFKSNNILKSVKTLKSELKMLQKDKNIKILFKNINYDDVDFTQKSQSMPTRISEEGNPQFMNTTGFR